MQATARLWKAGTKPAILRGRLCILGDYTHKDGFKAGY